MEDQREVSPSMCTEKPGEGQFNLGETPRLRGREESRAQGWLGEERVSGQHGRVTKEFFDDRGVGRRNEASESWEGGHSMSS